jgi:hypothetical protein
MSVFLQNGFPLLDGRQVMAKAHLAFVKVS